MMLALAVLLAIRVFTLRIESLFDLSVLRWIAFVMSQRTLICGGRASFSDNISQMCSSFHGKRWRSAEKSYSEATYRCWIIGGRPSSVLPAISKETSVTTYSIRAISVDRGNGKLFTTTQDPHFSLLGLLVDLLLPAGRTVS